MKERLDDFFNKRPGMRKIYTFEGTFRDYCRQLAGKARSGEGDGFLADIVGREVVRLYSCEQTASIVREQLTRVPFVSYADHHGLLNYKLLYNSNLLYSMVIQELGEPAVVVFATGSVPLGNTSHPRGFYFRGHKLNFFPKKCNNIPVYLLESGVRPRGKGDLASFILNYETASFSSDERRFLKELFFDILKVDEVCHEYGKFSDQLSVLNRRLWRYFFSAELRCNVPDLIYLQSNQLIRLYLRSQLEDPGSLISLILFNKKAREIYLKNFHGIPACWGDNTGSHFFWGVVGEGDKQKLVSLTLDETANALCGEGISVPMEKDAVADAIMTNKLIQTSFFDLLAVTFLEGYFTLGGFNQLEYLPAMQGAHVQCLREAGLNHWLGAFAGRITDGLICGLMPFPFDSSLDLIWDFNSVGGVFSGRFDGGLDETFLGAVGQQSVRHMIEKAVETMMDNI